MNGKEGGGMRPLIRLIEERMNRSLYSRMRYAPDELGRPLQPEGTMEVIPNRTRRRDGSVLTDPRVAVAWAPGDTPAPFSDRLTRGLVSDSHRSGDRVWDPMSVDCGRRGRAQLQ